MAVRAWEFASLGLAPAQLDMMLGMQFNGQRSHYAAAYPDADAAIVERAGVPIGRILVDRGPTEWRLVDVALLPERSGQGIGSALLDGLIADAAHAGAVVTLSVRPENPARRLYLRKGFVETGWEGVDIAMVRVLQPNTAS